MGQSRLNRPILPPARIFLLSAAVFLPGGVFIVSRRKLFLSHPNHHCGDDSFFRTALRWILGLPGKEFFAGKNFRRCTVPDSPEFLARNTGIIGDEIVWSTAGEAIFLQLSAGNLRDDIAVGSLEKRRMKNSACNNDCF